MFWKAFDRRMRRAVQENRSLNPSLSSASSRRRQSRGSDKCCLLVFVLTPIFLVLMFMFLIGSYNTMVVEYEQQQQQQLLQLQHVNQESKEQPQQNLRKKEPPPQEQKDEEIIRVDETLVLTTPHGEIRILLRPDLSSGSVDYVRRLVKEGCRQCKFYRAEKPGILQGMMKNPNVEVNQVRGSCPDDGVAASVPNDCPSWDPHCGCHGPIMTRGMVAWAAGQAGGPDFFIDAYKRPAKWWGTQHTNFGQIVDADSLQVVDAIFDLPATKKSGLTYLEDHILFEMSLT